MGWEAGPQNRWPGLVLSTDTDPYSGPRYIRSSNSRARSSEERPTIADDEMYVTGVLGSAPQSLGGVLKQEDER